MLALMGQTVCSQFYFPLARKMWGLAPYEISRYQALVRIQNAGLKGVFLGVFKRFDGSVRLEKALLIPQRGHWTAGPGHEESPVGIGCKNRVRRECEEGSP